MLCCSGESEFRDLSGDESGLLRAAADGARPLPVSAFDPTLLQQLYKKGLVYLAIPIGPEDRFSIPPLEVGWLTKPIGMNRPNLHKHSVAHQQSWHVQASQVVYEQGSGNAALTSRWCLCFRVLCPTRHQKLVMIRWTHLSHCSIGSSWQTAAGKGPALNKAHAT